jgi:L-lysine exporter family protein LysE/ArgO
VVVVTALLAGLGLGLSLIIAIGAQNLFVLRQGIRREHVLAVVLVCGASDAVLIVAGVSGLGAVLSAVPWLVGVVRWLGAAFLVGYGLSAARRAARPRPEALVVEEDGRGASALQPVPNPAGSGNVAPRAGTRVDVPSDAGRRGFRLLPVIGTALALTWLNPHVYLDTVFLLGSVAASHGESRWWFALGAVIASLAWFTALGHGARFLGRALASPRAWRILDACIAIVMIALGVLLIVPAG